MTIHLEQTGSINTIQTGTSQANSSADLRITSVGTSGSTYMTIATSGNIGIGTTSPDSLLTVGTTSLNSPFGINLQNSSGSVQIGIAAIAGQWSNNSASGDTVIRSLNKKLLLQSGGAVNAAMCIDTSNNIGIGTNSPSSKLHINSATATNGSLLITGADNFGHSLYIASSDASKRLAFNNNGTVGNIFAYNYSSSASQNLCLQGPGGNVGIGSTIANCRLEVRRSNAINDGIPTTGTGDSTVFSFLHGATGDTYGLIGGVLSSSGTFWLQSKYTGTTGVLNMSLQPLGGNVGIGTNSPATGYGGAISNALLTIKGPVGANEFATMLIGAGNNHYSSISSIHTGNGLTDLYFGTASGAVNPTEKMRITNSGNVGIGTSAPGHRLHVIDSNTSWCTPAMFTAPTDTNRSVSIGVGHSNGGCWNIAGVSWSNANGINSRSNYGGLDYACWGVNLAWNGWGNVGIGTVTPNYRLDVQGGDINASGSVRSNGTALTSDQRVKENIVDADTSVNLQHILALQLKHYDYTPNFLEHTGREDESNYGFIAQEVKQIIPNAVDILPNNLCRTEMIEEPVLNPDGTPKLDADGNPELRINNKRVVIQEIPDFHFLKKELIFTEAIGALQELHKMFTNLKEEFDAYKQAHP